VLAAELVEIEDDEEEGRVRSSLSPPVGDVAKEETGRDRTGTMESPFNTDKGADADECDFD
jgi:hypothetical protein